MSQVRPYRERLLCFGSGAAVRAGFNRGRLHERQPTAASTGAVGGPMDAGLRPDRESGSAPDPARQGGLDMAVICDRPALTPGLDGVPPKPGVSTPVLAHEAVASGPGVLSLQVGETHGHLIGTLTLPVPEPMSQHLAHSLRPVDGAVEPVGVLLLNAGILPRGGPHRFNVKLARRLATLGLPVLRFDLSGHGDSGPSPGTLGYHEQTLADLRAAADALCELAGVTRIVVVGICSGAQAGWHAALEDPRIVGLAMLDGHAYPGPLTWLLHHWQRMRARTFPEQIGVVTAALGRSFNRVVARPLRRVLGRSSRDGAPAVEEATQPGLGPADRLPVQLRTEAEYAEGMARLTDRGMRCLIVYSCGWMAFYSYAGQYRHVFGRHAFSREVRLVFAPELDHTLTLVESQDAVAGWIEDWLAQNGLGVPVMERR